MEDVDIHLCRGYILVGRRGRLTEGAARVCAVPWGEGGGGGEMATWGREKDNKYVNYIGTFDRRQWGQRRRGTTTDDNNDRGTSGYNILCVWRWREGLRVGGFGVQAGRGGAGGIGLYHGTMCVPCTGEETRGKSIEGTLQRVKSCLASLSRS